MILCENGPDGRPALFDGASRLIMARSASEVLPALQAADAARAGGAWIAGWIGYEAGYALEPRLAPLMRQGAGPLLVLGVYGAPRSEGEPVAPDGRMTRPEPVVTRAAYDAAFARVAAYIAAGECYQINLTFPMRARLTGSALGLYARLRGAQPVGHGGFAAMGEGPVVICRSPELFVAVNATGTVQARPMKGTAPRDPDPVRDAALATELFESEKARAENLMIVDLLRNDIGRISQVGSVAVPELFHVEAFATLHQMSSRITGRLAAPASLSTLMRALFPCGSITGAPKIRAMEIIREVEPTPRGAYCGAFGWMAPDGRAAFSVSIRTLSITGDAITMNVGGGVVHDSTAQGEWEEALWKARFATLAM